MKLSFSNVAYRGRNAGRARPSSRRRVLLIVGIAALVTMTGVGAAIRSFDSSVRVTETGPAPAPQAGPATRSRLHSRLGVQPDANRMRRRLGQRFLRRGREMIVQTGALTVAGQSQPVTIARAQDDDDGEQVSIAIGGGPASLTWTAKDGARSNNAPAAANERKLIERIALDSPDQFVLAQVRGASYYTLAQGAMPEEVASDDYTGPVWDVIRVAEAFGSSAAKPESLYRLYYINSTTGLIEKVLHRAGPVSARRTLGLGAG